MSQTRPPLLPAAVALAALLIPACGSPLPPPHREPNVLLITIDTLRADHLGCAGHGVVKTPRIDALAGSGVMFTNAVCSTPLTLPSHCTIMTGTHPPFHGVRDNGTFLLSPDNLTLAEVLKERGYSTAAFVSAFVLDRRFGLSQGFDLYDDATDRGCLSVPSLEGGEKEVGIRERPADRTTGAAMRWLEEHRGGPFFAWVHYYDPHAAYNPPSPWRETWWGDLYSGEIAFTDEWVGRLLDKLKTLGLERDTVVVLTSDHGEGLGEHEERTHAVLVYEATVHVPLIISWPGRLPRGVRVDAAARSVDIMPSVLDLLGLRDAAPCQGASLIPLARGEGANRAEPAVYSESLFGKFHHHYASLRSLREGRWKYIHSNRPELFDLSADPREMVNVIDRRPAEASRLKARLASLLRESASKRVAGESLYTPDEETMQQLRALGYFGAGAPPAPAPEAEDPDAVLDTADERDLPNPRDMMEVLDDLQNAGNLMRADRYDDARPKLESVLARDPKNIQARLQFAECLSKQGDAGRAAAECRGVLAFDPGNPGALSMLGKVSFDAGRFEEAREAMREVLKVTPRSIEARRRIALSRWAEGDISGAVGEFEALVRDHPRYPAAMNSLGYIYVERGLDPAGGLRLIREALSLSPDDPSILDSLGWACLALGEPAEALGHMRKAAAAESDNPEILAHLAAVCEANGLPSEAGRHMRKAVSLGFTPSPGGTGESALRTLMERAAREAGEP